MLNVETVNTNITEAKSLLTYDQVVETLGMRVGLEGNLPATAPGTTVSVDWQSPNADGTPGGALVHVVLDHNFVPPQPAPAAGAGTGDASLNSDGSAPPATPPVPPPAGGALALGGLQIPSAPTA